MQNVYILYGHKVGVRSFDCLWCITNSKSTSQLPSGRNVSPHCDRAGLQCSLTLILFFTPSPSASSPPSVLVSPALSLFFYSQAKLNRSPLSIVTDLPTSVVAPCSSGSSWSLYWTTQPMATLSPGPVVAWSSNSSSLRRSVSTLCN